MKLQYLFPLIFIVFLMGCINEELQNEFVQMKDNGQTELTQSPLISYNSYQEKYSIVKESKSNGNRVTKLLKIFSSTGTIEFVMPVECPPGSAFEVLIQGEGNASHLGLYNNVITFCSSNMGEPLTPILGTMTAANGDEIYHQLIFAGVGGHNGIHMDYPFHQDYIIYDGTGRFEDATGDITLFGEVVYPVPPANPIGTFNLTGEGTITY
jgi:hypothetical protein